MTQPLTRPLTGSALEILGQAARRAGDRGLHHVDASSFVVLVLRTLIRWERKVGLVVLETMGVDLERLDRDLDRLLQRRAEEHPVVADGRTGNLVFKKTGEAYVHWDFDATSQPLREQAEHEASQMQHDYVGTEHLLLAVISRADPELRAILNHHLMTGENVRATTLELLHSWSG